MKYGRKQEQNLKISLAIIRISTASFLLVWSMGKLIAPALSQMVFANFYFASISPFIMYVLGILQTAIVVIFLVGFLKTFSYGVVLGMHSVSVLSTFEKLLSPYDPPNILFWAGIPVLGALIVLFLLRDCDRLLTIHR